jgi:hypothetical protein
MAVKFLPDVSIVDELGNSPLAGRMFPLQLKISMPLAQRRRKSVAIARVDALAGEDLRPLPLVERKRSLRRLIRGQERLLFVDQIQGSGVELFQAICARDLKRIVAKHRLGPYEPMPMTWFKILNPAYTQKRGRKEMFDKFREHQQPTAGHETMKSLL